MRSNIGRERLFSKDFPGRSDVVIWEVLHIDKEQSLKISLLNKNSPFNQGVRIAIDAGQQGFIESEGGIKTKEVHLWWYSDNILKEIKECDDLPRVTIMKCQASEGLVSVFNMYHKGDFYRFHSHFGGMIIEEKNNKIIYRCNDFGETKYFDKLVFSIEIL